MATQQAVISSEQEQAKSDYETLWALTRKRFRRNTSGVVGLVIISLLVFIAVFAPWISPAEPNMQILEYAVKPPMFQGKTLLKRSALDGATVPIAIQSYSTEKDSVRYVDLLGRNFTIEKSELAGGSEKEWYSEPLFVLGTDRYGRDVLSRLFYGTRISIAVGLISQGIALVIGIILGACAGYFRGWIDDVIMWLVNVVWSFPSILLVIALSVVLGQGFWQTFVAIGIASWVEVARIVRGQFFSLRETEFVEAAQALGFGKVRIIFRHIFPNTLGPVTVIATAGFASAIVAEAGLSFLGLGVQPPTASWGQMVRDGYGYIAAGVNWGLTLYPSIAIALAVFGFNLIGDGLRDAFDPKTQIH